MAIPVCWQLLNKAGNASAKEHQAIVERFITWFGKEHIARVVADREFGSGDLFKWFNQQGIPFYIRIKEDSNAWVSKAKRNVKKLFNHLRSKEMIYYPNYVSLFGQKCQLAASRSDKGELMIVATNQSPKNAIAVYLKRWEIENLFQSLKDRGFRFEDTHLTQHERLNKLIALLVIGFCWAHKVGEWKATRKHIKFYQHPDKTYRPQYSYFRYGFVTIRDVILHRQQFYDVFLQILSQLMIMEGLFMKLFKNCPLQRKSFLCEV